MAKTTLVLKDKFFRIVVPEAVRIAEGISLGDVIEVDITKAGVNSTVKSSVVEKPKRPVGRPKKYSSKPCGACGHYEDIHEADASGQWTGKCLHEGCDCTGFSTKKQVPVPVQGGAKNTLPTIPPVCLCGHFEFEHDDGCTVCACKQYREQGHDYSASP
jgi:bifunctional DNA-binding transcriptional regulator/antitoxin component of YhaV-PrlF toxin-antitoxin module